MLSMLTILLFTLPVCTCYTDVDYTYDGFQTLLKQRSSIRNVTETWIAAREQAVKDTIPDTVFDKFTDTLLKFNDTFLNNLAWGVHSDDAFPSTLLTWTITHGLLDVESKLHDIQILQTSLQCQQYTASYERFAIFIMLWVIFIMLWYTPSSSGSSPAPLPAHKV